ncbi:MAG: peptidylprolyl isomerase [bacterium]
MTRSRFFPFLFLAAIPFATAFGEDFSPVTTRNTVFLIDGKPVVSDEFLLFEETLFPGEGSGGTRSPAHLADTFINNRLLAAKATAEGMDLLPEVRSRLESRLNPLWVEPYWDEVVRPTVHVGEDELRALIPELEETVTMRLLVAPDRDQAEALRKRALSGDDFTDLARRHSTGLSAGNGGLLGPLERGSGLLDPPLSEELFRTPPGNLTRVVETRIGFAVALVLHRKSREEMRDEGLARNRAMPVRKRETAAWKARKETLVASHTIVVEEGIERAVREAGTGVPLPADLLSRPGFHMDGVPFLLQDLLDPSGIGILHGGDVLRTAIRKRAEEFAIARDAAGKGMREQHPEIVARETILRENLLAREYLRLRGKGLDASESELRRYFEANRSRFVAPKALDLSFIETKSPQRAERIYTRLAAGVPFAEVAEEESDNREATGGRVGFVEENRLAAELGAVKRLKVGEYAPAPLRVRSADTGEELLVIPRLNGVRERRPLRFEEVDRHLLLQAVVARKREALAGKIFEDLRSSHRVEITPEFRNLARSGDVPAEKRQRGTDR